MKSSLNFLHIRREDEISGNKPKSPCVEVCTMFKNISKYVKKNLRGTHTSKFFKEDEVRYKRLHT
jgi:hypothetical protein